MPLIIFISLLLNSSFAFDWQGHRGARGLYPENTVAAMKEAVKYPVTTLELDTVISKDLKVVVSHEPWMNDEICLEGGKKVNLYRMTYDEIKKFDCGSKKHPRFPDQRKVVERKPLLAELLSETKGEGKNYNVEIKSTPEDEKKGFQPDYKTFSDLVVKEMLSQLSPERFVIQSFDWRVLKYIKEKYPQIALSALSEKSLSAKEVVESLGFVPEIYSPFFKGLTLSQIKEFQSRKIKVIPWTVNTVEEMTSLIDRGVDGIITDYPNLIEQASSSKSKKP